MANTPPVNIRYRFRFTNTAARFIHNRQPDNAARNNAVRKIAAMSNVKTNAMRILDKHKIAYKTYCYAATGAVSGTEVAAALGQNPAQVFKTLVTAGKSGTHYVFMLPVAAELDLKKPPAPSMKNRWKC